MNIDRSNNGAVLNDHVLKELTQVAFSVTT
jgi:hypothetical protein